MAKTFSSSAARQQIVSENQLFDLSVASQWLALRGFFQGVGSTGILNVRQYEHAGDLPTDRRFTVGYRPLNMHDHSNYRHLCGMAERTGIANGYLYKSRHTDYHLRHPVSTGYLNTEEVAFPAVPASVTGTVTQQITEMQNYFQAMVDNSFATYDFRSHFTLALAVEEVWPEAYSETLSDTFDSDRHTVDASNVQEQVWKHWRDEYGGIMDRAENINVWPTVPMITGENTAPELATIKNRVTVQVVGDLGEFHPSDIFAPRPDLYSERRAGVVPPPVENQYTRYQVKHAVGSSVNGSRNTPGILDTFMSRCFGIEGIGSNLTETYWDKESAIDYNVKNWADNDDLNAAAFSRFVGLELINASGRHRRRRGFSDPNLFCALTTDENVIGVSDLQRLHRYSWGIPLEVVLLNPLMTWNPHNIPFSADPTAGGTLDGLTSGTAYNGYNESEYHYLTPDAFYNGTDQTDAADTSSARWVLDDGGTPRLCRSSGPWIVFPSIDNVTGRVRGRWPIYEDAIQSPAMAQAIALRA